MAADRLLRWTREPDPAWVRTLARIAPRRDGLSHLTIRWVPFHNRRLAQRWIIFECVPVPFCNRLIPYVDHDDVQSDPLKYWAYTYLMEHRALPVPFWVCQGNPMGHPYAYNPREKAQAKLGQIPSEPPAPGELPYHEPSALTWEGIMRRSLLTRGIRDAMAQREHEKREADKMVRQGVLDDIDARLTDVIDEAHDDLMAISTVQDRAPRGAISQASIPDEAFSQYVETGHFPYVHQPS